MGMSAGTAAMVTSMILKALVQGFHALNHQQCRSKCCGRSFEAALDVDKTPRAARVDEAIAHALAQPSPPRALVIGLPKD